MTSILNFCKNDYFRYSQPPIWFYYPKNQDADWTISLKTASKWWCAPIPRHFMWKWAINCEINWKWKLWSWFRTFLWFLVIQALGCKHADLTGTFIQLMLGRPLPFFLLSSEVFGCNEVLILYQMNLNRASSSLTHLILMNKNTEGIVQPINEKSVIMSCVLWEFLSSSEQTKKYESECYHGSAVKQDFQ